MMKTVWILNHYAETPGGASGARHFYLSKYLEGRQWKAILIASSVEHPSGRQRIAGPEKFKFEQVGGVDYFWVRGPSYRGNGKARIIGMLSYSLNVLRPKFLASLKRPDLIIGSSVHPFAALAAWVLSVKYKVPFIFEVRDLWPQTLVDMGRLKRTSFLTQLFYKLEFFLYTRASKIIVLMPGASDYIAKRGVNRDKVFWLSNGSDVEDFPVFPEPSNPTFCFMYFGAHGEANALDVLLDAMGIIKSRTEAALVPRVKLRLIGDGPLKSGLIDKARDLGLADWITFESSVSKSQIPSVAAEADAFVISVLNLPALYRYGISMNKIFDYMAAARPIVIAVEAYNDPVVDADCGISVPPSRPDLLADAMIAMAKASKEDRRELGRKARSHVMENYNYRALAGKLADILDEVIADAENQ